MILFGFQIFDVPAAKTLWTKIVDPNDRNCFVNVSTGETDWNPPNEEEGVVTPFDQLIGGFLGALDTKQTCSEQPQSSNFETALFFAYYTHSRRSPLPKS